MTSPNIMDPPAGSSGMTRRAVLIGGTATAALTGKTAATLAAIPSWMALKVETHREANEALNRADDEIDAMLAVSSAINEDDPPAWLLEAEQRRDAAGNRAKAALDSLLNERPRSLADVQIRARYLIEAGFAEPDHSIGRRLLFSMIGEAA